VPKNGVIMNVVQLVAITRGGTDALPLVCPLRVGRVRLDGVAVEFVDLYLSLSLSFPLHEHKEHGRFVALNVNFVTNRVILLAQVVVELLKPDHGPVLEEVDVLQDAQIHVFLFLSGVRDVLLVYLR